MRISDWSSDVCSSDLEITPIYPQSDKARLYSKDFRGWLRESLERAGEFIEPLPSWLLDEHDLITRTAAFSGIHTPESMGEAEAARRRLVFDELLRMQLALVMRKRRIEAKIGRTSCRERVCLYG